MKKPLVFLTALAGLLSVSGTLFGHHGTGTSL